LAPANRVNFAALRSRVTGMTQTWTVTLTPNPLQTSPVVTATDGQTELHVNVQYGQILPVRHNADCAYGTSLAAHCDCLNLDNDTRDQILTDAKATLLGQSTPVPVVEPIVVEDRTIVVHSNRGWLRWDTNTNQPTSEVIAPIGSITHLDPRDCGTAHQGTYHLYAVAA
jgi:hypothetical protein